MSGFVDPEDDSSLTSAVIRAALNRAAPIGMMVQYLGTSAPTGWVLGDGSTIGNSLSGATGRADDDTEDLFSFLWTNFANTELIIQTSAGAATTRGLSASADFAANKRIPTPDIRGRIPLGNDSMGGTSANRVTDTEADTNGKTEGEESHVLTESELAAHNHGFLIKNAVPGGFTALGPANCFARTSQSGGSIAVSDTPDTLIPDASIADAGGNAAHNNVQPYITVYYIIKL